MKYPKIVLLLLAALVLAACTTKATPEVKPPLPTPNVPPISEVESAISRWQKSPNPRYFAQVEERDQEGVRLVRLVVADDQVRAAQVLVGDGKGNWQEPRSLTIEEAQAFTIQSLLERVRQDVLAMGPAPYNMRVAFDKSLGFPAVIHAEALPTYNEAGNVVLNREHSYDLSMQVKALLEDTFRPGEEPFLLYTRSGGPQAWCDTLRIFPDGSSVYSDDCRDQVLQIDLPHKQLADLQALSANFATLDALREAENQSEHLLITGSGEGSPDAETQEAAWQLANKAHEILSEPIGLGLTMLYFTDNTLFGMDVFNQNVQPARMDAATNLRGAVISPDSTKLAFADDKGLQVLDIANSQLQMLLPAPEQGYYLPGAWSASDKILVSHIPAEDGGLVELGWVSPSTPGWNPLPAPEGFPGYGCETGFSFSPDGSRLAITGLGYGAPCNLNPGLTIVDLEAGSVQKIVATEINAGTEDGGKITAGAHTPAWSPDGEWIVFGLDQDASEVLTFPTRLYRVRPDGSDLSPLTNNARGRAADPVWSPDGMLYYSLDGFDTEEDGIYRYNPADNQHSLFIPGSELHPVSISPLGEYLLYEQGGAFQLWGFVQEQVYSVNEAQAGQPVTFSGWLTVPNE